MQRSLYIVLMRLHGREGPGATPSSPSHRREAHESKIHILLSCSINTVTPMCLQVQAHRHFLYFDISKLLPHCPEYTIPQTQPPLRKRSTHHSDMQRSY